MTGAKTTAAGCIQFELEIEINASCERVWKALIEETNYWWLPDFHILGGDSVVSFDPAPGGRGLFEELEDGGGLLWFSVQYYRPEKFTIYLFGNVAPDWGGPSTSNLKIMVEPAETGCILKVVDARHGNVDPKEVSSHSDGWTQLFGDGLRQYVEDAD